VRDTTPPPEAAQPVPAATWFIAAWAICVKDLRVWLRHPWQVVATMLVPVSYTLVAFLGSSATGANPVAVVNLDHGPEGGQIVQSIDAAQVFRLHLVDAAAARRLYDENQVAAIVTIPADTTSLLRHHQPAPAPPACSGTTSLLRHHQPAPAPPACSGTTSRSTSS
jgi:hypothetical protein